MTRPALVIGVGGTGQWILTFIKKELLEMNGGEMPQSVRLLAIDTASRTAQGGLDIQGAAKQEKQAVLGDVVLEEDVEFFSIGDDLWDLAQGVKAGKYPHLSWFPARSLIDGKGLPHASFQTKQGAGAIRQMGRLSLFNKVDLVLGRIKTAMESLQTQVTGSRDSGENGEMRLLEVIIVGSMAGGTGAGMMIDMAWLTRMQARKLGLDQKMVIRGFFVLPSAFTNAMVGANRDMLSRTFACWTELDRFQLSNLGSGGFTEIAYKSTDSDFKVKCDQPPYDVTYLIDGRRPERPIFPPAEEGVFPMVAQCITMVLDSEAGVQYTEHVINTISSARATLPPGVYHSAIGSYTIKVPVYYAKSKFTRSLAKDTLGILLAPRIENGKIIGVAFDKNAEVEQGKAGYESALEFMGASVQESRGTAVQNTEFLPLVSKAIKAKKAGMDGKMVTDIAKGAQKVLLVQAVSNVGQDPDGQQILKKISSELNLRVWDEKGLAPSSEYGDKPEDAITRLMNGVPKFRIAHYGTKNQAGERTRGTYGEALEEAKRVQLDRFRRMLQIWTLNTLNGLSPDPRKAKGGKLGYVRAFYKSLSDCLGDFMVFVNDVRKFKSEDLHLITTRQKAAKEALDYYRGKASKKCWLTFWDGFTHPDAYQAQRNYLNAEQGYIEARKEDILLDVMFEIADDMRKYVDKTLEETDSWITVFATGSGTQTSMYSMLTTSLSALEENYKMDLRLGNPDFAEEKTLERIIQVIGRHEYQLDPQQVDKALANIEWQVDTAQDALQIKCGVLQDNGIGQEKTYKPFKRIELGAEKANAKTILQLAEIPYEVLPKEKPFGEVIKMIYANGTTLAERLQGWGDPYYQPVDAGSRLGARVKAGFVRVHYEAYQEYFVTQFMEKLKVLADETQVSWKLVESEDEHKLTVIKSDDLMPSMDFQLWHEARQQYLTQISDPNSPVDAADQYAFPAERNAAYYEQQVPLKLRQDYRKFHPEIVGLMEDREHFVMFFLAKANGFIRQTTDENKDTYWIYQADPATDPIWLSEPRKQLSNDHTKRTTFLDVMRAFLAGADVRAQYRNQRINWEKLYQAIVRKETASIDKTIALYKDLIIVDKKGSIIADIKREQTEDLDNNRALNEGLQVLATPFRQRYIDLIDAVTCVFIDRINDLQKMK